MTRRLQELFALGVAVACLCSLSAIPASAQQVQRGPLVLHPTHQDTSLPLWQMAIPVVPHVGPPRTIGILRGSTVPQTTIRKPDPVGQDITKAGPVPTVDLLNFDGQNVGGQGLAPPDTEGVVGATQYVQWVNIEYNVYDKTTGAKIVGPFQGNSFWSGFGGACQNNNDGDPIIQYDKVAGVWFAAQNVFVTPYTACIAVSTTNDATGTYNRYSFSFGNTTFPDYPKWGVWPDAYYQSWNNFTNGISLKNSEVCALDRNAILTGGSPTLQCFNTANSSQASTLPSDQDGLTPPPAGAPNHFVDIATTTGNLNEWDFHVDFVNPSNSTFSGPNVITTAAFTEICSNGSNRACIAQPSPGEKVDSLGDRLMYRNAYRNFGTYESLLDNHTVAPTQGTATSAIRWYELRSTPPGGTFSVYQQGTIQTPSTSIWMGSIAQDKLGDIAIGFSLTGKTPAIDPSVAYTGRRFGAPLGVMEGMKRVVLGKGVQESTANRWGDYSMMSVDPADDCTFWFTEEYYATTGSFNWSTRINSFKFNNCN